MLKSVLISISNLTANFDLNLFDWSGYGLVILTDFNSFLERIKMKGLKGQVLTSKQNF